MRPKRIAVYLAATLLAIVVLSQVLTNAAAAGGASSGRMIGWLLGIGIIFLVARWVGRRWDPDDAA